MTVAEKISLADARAELRITLDALAASAKLSKVTVVRAEKGEPIRRISAYAILQVLNAERVSRGMPSLSIYDLDWQIDGA